jgi:hypothetical protein
VPAASIIRAIAYNPEDSHLHTRRRKNLKSHKVNNVFFLDSPSFPSDDDFTLM